MNALSADHVIDLEKKLHKAEVRKKRETLDTLLADDFCEIGTSGKFYSTRDILERLPSEAEFEIESFDFKTRSISTNLLQIFYKTSSKHSRSFRNSIWRFEDGIWQIIFHQGTPLA